MRHYVSTTVSSVDVVLASGAHVTKPRNHLVVLAVVGVSSLAAGALTSLGQTWLPDEARSIANSAGSWALVAFLLALLATTAWVAAACGTEALLALLAGYVVTSIVRDFAVSRSMVVFWTIAALAVGPILGLGAHWLRRGPALLASLSLASISGVLIGEGIYGLRYIADTTYPPLWWGEIALGVAVLVAGAVLWLKGIAAGIGAALTSLVVAGAFVLVYSRAGIG